MSKNIAMLQFSRAKYKMERANKLKSDNVLKCVWGGGGGGRINNDDVIHY